MRRLRKSGGGSSLSFLGYGQIGSWRLNARRHIGWPLYFSTNTGARGGRGDRIIKRGRGEGGCIPPIEVDGFGGTGANGADHSRKAAAKVAAGLATGTGGGKT
jgi:hypothetical protein